MLQDVLAFAALPLAAAVIFTGIHTWFGLQVLRRNVVFADLALAQVSALGATVAAVIGHPVSSAGAYAYTLLFAAGGALLLTASRHLAYSVRQEAFIGVLYVVATAATVLVVDRSPQGAEHVKKMLIGGILSVSADELIKFALLYAVIGALHWVIRMPLLAAANEMAESRRTTAIWDLVFYLSFGLVVTSSVSVAGVLLVFCFLIVPALVGSLFSQHIEVALIIGWAAGAVASACGIFGSFALDAPTGAVMVLAFAAVLIMAGGVRAFITAPAAQRSRNRSLGLRVGAIMLCAACALSGLWLVAAPAGDQPVLALVEMATGIGPEYYLTERERADFIEATATERRHKAEVDRIHEIERRSRWQGAELSPDEVRRIASVQQTLTEMGRGEHFVVDYLRTRARERERWYVGLPLATLGMTGLAFIAWSARPRSNQG
jgi:zinc/manganese transport system permease protein